jgi:outer membrane protein OmpA-like peptidoglycan-associated protein
VIVQWDALKQKSGPSSVAMIVERGARALAPLFEKAGIPAQRALELGRIFFEHLASSASDEVGKRAVDAVFDPFSNADAPQGGPNVDSASRSRRIFSLQTAAVRFDLDRAVLPPSGQGTVQRLLELVPTRNALWLLIGSTDRTGSEARNTRLANERTAAVADYLIRSEIPRQLIIRKAIPELLAPIPGYDGALDPENRKTEITVLIVNRG